MNFDINTKEQRAALVQSLALIDTYERTFPQNRFVVVKARHAHVSKEGIECYPEFHVRCNKTLKVVHYDKNLSDLVVWMSDQIDEDYIKRKAAHDARKPFLSKIFYKA